MNRPEDRAAASDVTRRDFIQASVAAGAVAGGGLGAFYFGYGRAVGSPVRVGILGTGDQGGRLIGAINPEYLAVRAIADIRPYNIWRAFYGDYSSDADLEARPGLLRVYGWKTEQCARKHVKVYDHTNGGFQELLNNARADGLEAVIIALPPHLHAAAAIAALTAKTPLHVFVERPMAPNVPECKEMARAAQQARRYLAIGHQRHYNFRYQNAIDFIQRGTVGLIHYIRAQWHLDDLPLPGKDRWQPPLPPGVKPAESGSDELDLDKRLANYKKQLAAALKAGAAKDIDKWAMLVAQVDAQRADKAVDAAQFQYRPQQAKDAKGKPLDDKGLEELIRWRLWDRCGGGLWLEYGGDLFDAINIYLAAEWAGKEQPARLPLHVDATSSRSLFLTDRGLEDHACCLLEFAAEGYKPKDPVASRKRVGVQCALVKGSGFGGFGEIVYGDKGALVLEGEEATSIARGPSGASAVQTGAPSLDTQASAGPAAARTREKLSRGYIEELEHWAWCIRHGSPDDQRIQPRCGPQTALASVVMAVAARQSAQQGKRIVFDEEWFEPGKDATPEGTAPDVTRYQA